MQKLSLARRCLALADAPRSPLGAQGRLRCGRAAGVASWRDLNLDLDLAPLLVQVGGVQLWKELNEQLKSGRLGAGTGSGPVHSAAAAAAAAAGPEAGVGSGLTELGSGFGSGPDAATKLALQSGIGFDIRR